MSKRLLFSAIAACGLFLTACSLDPEPSAGKTGPLAEPQPAAEPPADPADKKAALVDKVAAMGALDRAYDARFSPAGDRLLYLSSETGLPQLFLADLNSGHKQQVSAFEDQIRGVAWSPDGAILALDLAPGGGLNRQIYLRPLEGGDPVRITAGGRSNNWLGDWSEDGRFLAYSSDVAGDGSMDAWLYDTETGDSRMISDNSGIGVIADLSPDATRAVVWRMRSRGNTNLYLVDVATGEEQLMTPHEGVALSSNAHFVGDERIVFASNIDREMLALAEVRVDDKGRITPLNYIVGRDDAELEGIEIIKDGEEAVLTWNAAGRSELAVVDLVSNTMRPGPASPAELVGISDSSPDGQRLALTVSGSTTPTNVWVLDLSLGQFKQVTETDPLGLDFEHGEIVSAASAAAASAAETGSVAAHQRGAALVDLAMQPASSFVGSFEDTVFQKFVVDKHAPDAMVTHYSEVMATIVACPKIISGRICLE
ncbi:MAG: hypothetical protein JJ992_23515 [Planctomycetes bacterium]|nr:hypothetical protein [Planctomycetota bacterium]